jgi:seryl-tRNA synthetase
MINLKSLRENPEQYIEAARRKRVNIDILAFLSLDEQYRSLKTQVEELRARQNSFNKEIPNLKGDQRTSRISELKELSVKLKEQEVIFRELEQNWQSLVFKLPTVPLDQVPDGVDDSENVPAWDWGTLPEFQFKHKDHVEIGRELNLFDIERGVKVAGARQYFLKGDGTRLHHAILKLAMDHLYKDGFTLFEPPLIVKHEAMLGTGYFPGGEDQAYRLDERDENSYLIGTSEVPVCALHMDEIIPENELPKLYAGHSVCFRREAGAAGKDTHGLYRVHQFSKVEQVVICKADVEESGILHERILKNAEKVMQLLELPYRVVVVCAGDMGLGQVFKHDIEAWMPSRGKYSETHSCSTFHEFQARRLKIRYRDANGEVHYCHTLNNTCIASPRILIPLLEVHQQQDGSVRIPDALVPYMNGQEKIVLT